MPLTQPIPLTLYIHLPWCVRKCPYCDFNSHEAPATLPETAYVNALIAELDTLLPRIWGRKLSAIFFGGGTPSLFSPHEIERLLLAVHARLPFHRDMEITLEANPGTVDQSHFEGLRNAGINRLSIGIQSFSSPHLKILGRIHGRDDAMRAIDAAKQAGFTNFNLDLMHGLPEQTPAQALEDIRTAITFSPTHLSWYQLTIEPNTYFYKHQPIIPSDDIVDAYETEGFALLAEHGYEHYEVSAFAKPDYRCLHNINYWTFGDYIGIGAGAHSKLTDLQSQTITRHWNVKHPKLYLDPRTSLIADTQVLTPQDSILEFMLNACRLREGFTFALFTARTGLSPDVLLPELTIAREKKLLTYDDVGVTFTALGKRHVNAIVSGFQV